jgi:hypothetical protein
MTIAFPFLISMIPVGIALVILLVGLALGRYVVPSLGFIVAGFRILFGAVFGPALFTDKVRVDETHIEQATGFWFHQTRKGFQFDDLRRVRIAVGRDLKGREIEIWVAEYESRPTVHIDPGDLWESHGALIVDYLRSLDIDVVRTR